MKLARFERNERIIVESRTRLRNLANAINVAERYALIYQPLTVSLLPNSTPRSIEKRKNKRICRVP